VVSAAKAGGMIDMVTLPGFTEDWFGRASCDVLAGLVRSVADVEGLIVEIGSWEGRSTIAMANATTRQIQAVDTWQGSPGEISADLAAKRDVFAKFQANILHSTKGNVYPNRMGWRQFFNDMRNAGPFVKPPVALLFIDAEHTYQEVHDTVLAFLPYMAPGSVICGDDAHHPPIKQALDDLFGLATVEADATLWIHRVPS
jgi:hypothetical protein